MEGSKVYSSDFYAYNNRVALASASAVIPTVAASLSPGSVLDVGCGVGAWCRVWLENGADTVIGTDGAYVDRDRLLVEADRFVPADLAQPFDLGRHFDLVMSLEVAEHVPEAQADTFVANLVRHGEVILFSAAVPGQGGEYHVNEQPLEYWKEKFHALGYQCFDPFRPLLRDNAAVAPWYRFNTLLYVAEPAIATLDGRVLASRVEEGQPLGDSSPLWWRLRNGALGLLPNAMADALARARSSWVRMRHARA
ncbi:class I SAM-dependent methyltransferase [Luteimonas saliphila]|uniref:class I SAM-dependent methyltransferase n=1 Tax=Luteimonas saliphila TaxID=2804919 RepID=UPI00192D4994|nr:class I SAM-dependent methyltransferase [Luteimonas saliphila]